MKYAHYDQNTGKLLGWYDKDIHQAIPEPYLEVSDEQWQTAIDNNYNYVDSVNKTLGFKDFRTLSEIKQAKISEINSKAKQEIISGFISDALGTQHLYQSKEVDQLNLIGLVSAGQDDYFKCSADGGSTWKYKLHTIDQLKQVLADGKKKKLEILMKASQLKEQVKNATTKEEVEAIIW